MAQIRTVDGKRHKVKETLEEINDIMHSPRVLQTGIMRLNWLVILSGRKNGTRITVQKYDPVSFIVSNIMMYY